jgi:3-hydroxy-9,10-secoandrosta-1,3,5(10)-triene-9,17-dione monooxygenase reductase component
METVTFGGASPNTGRHVDAKLFRAVCGQFVTGVAVVTTTINDEPVGLTVNSFTSVSLDPPLVLFCLHKRSGVVEVLRQTRRFAVNILADDQEEVCRTFAGKPGARFTGVPTRTARTGSPIFDHSLAYLDCAYLSETDGGDHTIVLGEVVDLGVIREAGNPLTYFRSAHAPIGSQS